MSFRPPKLPNGWWLAVVLFCFCAPPLRAQSVTGFTPTFGGAGTQVTISGSGFAATTRVRFDTTEADFSIINNSQIVATVPTNALTGKISVTAGATVSSTANFNVAPRVEGFTPVFASVGAQIQITGANFLSGAGQTGVRFGGVAATVINVTAPNLVFANIPAGGLTGPITVSTFAGTNSSSSNLVVSGTAVITGFTPPSGGFGAQIIISGGDFTGASALRFNGTNAAFSVTATTQIIATVPTNATSGPIEITTPSGTASSTSNFVVLGSAPVVTGFTPGGGRPGDPVVITGFNFIGVTNVAFNGTNAAFGVTSETQIGAIVPANVTSGPITLTSQFGTGTSTNSFSIVPLITNIAPVNGTVGTLVTINGENLSGVTNVNFNGAPAAFTNTAPNQIHALVPTNATTGPIQVIAPGGSNSSVTNFTVTVGIPAIAGFSPANGLIGSQVLIDGAHFTGATNVSFNGVSAAFGATSDAQISANVPAGATTGFISISGPGGTGTTTNLFYLPPRLTAFTPAGAVAGATVTITGTNFTGATKVEFTGSNSVPVAASFSIVNDQRIDAVVPTNVVNGPLTINAPGGAIISTANFTILPRVDGFTPLLGPPGTSVQIAGLNFDGATAVRFGSVASAFTLNSPTLLTATVPPGGLIGPIAVSTAAGTTASATSFHVTSAADVGQAQTNAPSISLFGDPVDVQIVVTNKGPSIVTGVRVTDTLPPFFGFVSATSTLGSCSFNAGVVTCDLGVLTNGRSALITIRMNPGSPGLWENQVQVTQSETEINSGDNLTFLSIPVVSESDRTLAIQRITGVAGVTLSWPVSAASFVLQFNTNLTTTNNLWTDAGLTVFRVTNAPTVINTATDGTELPRKFYRLRSP